MFKATEIYSTLSTDGGTAEGDQDVKEQHVEILKIIDPMGLILG